MLINIQEITDCQLPVRVKLGRMLTLIDGHVLALYTNNLLRSPEYIEALQISSPYTKNWDCPSFQREDILPGILESLDL